MTGKEPMKVYVVMLGERSEGGDVEAIYTTREAATAFALTRRTHFGPWVGGPDTWISGCDVLSVEEHEVRS